MRLRLRNNAILCKAAVYARSDTCHLFTEVTYSVKAIVALAAELVGINANLVTCLKGAYTLSATEAPTAQEMDMVNRILKK